MKNETSFISNYQRDFDAVVKPEEKSIPQFATNVPKMPSVEQRLCELSERINMLAMFVGVPHAVQLDGNLTLYPARKNGKRKLSDEAVSYMVDLTPYRNIFSEVRFKAMNRFTDDREIVRGIIIDEQGNVECSSSNHMNTSNLWTRLPITSNSAYLIASVPLKDGKPVWIPEHVEFMTKGLAQEVAEITDRLYSDALDTYNKDIFPLKLECKKLNSKLKSNEGYTL
ncbi:MAG: hypothetical protein J6U89_05290 [Bacteroidaceae bacterium]|nr:hypothetical protein [Bacteroidaceae bacterium]